MPLRLSLNANTISVQSISSHECNSQLSSIINHASHSHFFDFPLSVGLSGLVPRLESVSTLTPLPSGLAFVLFLSCCTRSSGLLAFRGNGDAGDDGMSGVAPRLEADDCALSLSN